MSVRESDPVRRFWIRVDKTETCWLWTGALHDAGYGSLRGPQGQTVTAHRVSWELHFGAVPDGLMVLHHCDVRHCVNPQHLFLGTAADNTQDMMAKGRHRRGQAPMKHSDAVVREIRDLAKDGMTYQAIADRYDTDSSYVSRLVNYQYRPGDQPRQKNQPRTTKLIEFRGETRSIWYWENHLGFKPNVIRRRLAEGWSVEKAFLTPLIPKTSTTGVRGVTWDKSRQRYQAYVSLQGKQHYLGRFKDLESASAAVEEFNQRNQPFLRPRLRTAEERERIVKGRR